MKTTFFILFLSTGILTLSAQTCLEIAIQKGQAAYNQGNYASAREFWEAGKGCQVTNVKKLNDLIWKTRDGDGDGVVNGRDECPNEIGVKSRQGCPELTNPILEEKNKPLSDRDGDGIIDKHDQCPDNPGITSLNGCPDLKDDDEDGTPNSQDECPTKYGSKQFQGCPDNDFDEIPDNKDACPDQPGPKSTAGCPDSDGDGVVNKDDQCPDTPGSRSLAGCPDSDNDGVKDAVDDCRDIPGLKRFNGCPDRDFDETPDHKDGCPDTPGPKTAYGCPDRDIDGVADKDDRCPDKPGVPENNGCPYERMVLITGGTFTMGDLFNDVASDETRHSVTLSDFYLGRTEVTFDEFDAFCRAVGREKPDDNGWGRGKRPVINVDWYDAVEYCNWLSLQEKRTPAYTIIKDRQDMNKANTSDKKKWIVTLNLKTNGYRLPTEAEWEFAARNGGKRARFGNGKDIADPAQINFNGSESYKTDYSVAGEYRGKTVEAGSLLSPNALGLHDMSGNVWEWCSDWYGAYESFAAENPMGVTKGESRVLRGGSFILTPQYCLAAARYYNTPTLRINSFGFRVALSFQ